jgi:hypothetical protein
LLFVGDLTEVYGIQSDEGEVGVLQDVVVEDETWSIAYLVIDVPAADHRMLLASDYVQTIDLAARRVDVAVSRDAILHSPAITAEEPVTPALERSLREYYDRYPR